MAFGALQSLSDLQRTGRSRTIDDDAKKWVLFVACQKPTEIGYAAETWTYSQLVMHIRKHAAPNGHHCLQKISRSKFIEFLRILDKKYPSDWIIRIVLDNHSSHISKETLSYLKTKPNRFHFIFTPKHGSWLNLIESFFSTITRSFLRHIRVDSKKELVERIYQGIEEINKAPVVFGWRYKMDEIATA